MALAHLSETINFAEVDEVAEALHLHPKTVQEKCRKGEIPATRLGRKWLIDVRKLREQLGQAS